MVGSPLALSQANVSPTLWLPMPSQLGQNRQSEHWWVLLTQQRGQLFLSCNRSLKLTRLQGWSFYPEKVFSIQTGPQYKKHVHNFRGVDMRRGGWRNEAFIDGPRSKTRLTRGKNTKGHLEIFLQVCQLSVLEINHPLFHYIWRQMILKVSLFLLYLKGYTDIAFSVLFTTSCKHPKWVMSAY